MTPYAHTAGHPFRFPHNAYKLGVHPTINHVFEWVRTQFEFHADCPEIWMVDHEHMQDAAIRTSHFTQIHGQVFGWYAPRFLNKVFVSDKAALASTLGKAVIVHELVHYLQAVTPKYDEIKPFQPQHISMLETEADRLMSLYVKL